MSKIICDVCGTSYPETAAQCPICGCVRPGDAKTVAGDTNETKASSAGSYTYVKGGRFSKSNVRKRNRANEKLNVSSPPAASQTGEDNVSKGLTIAVVVLLLAIVAVVLYIVLKFFGPNLFPGNSSTEAPSANNTTGSSTTVPDETTAPTDPEIPCTNLDLNNMSKIDLKKAGASWLLNVTVTPSDTTDEIFYKSSDESIATVTSDGKVTAVAPGEATITVSCGTVEAQCRVVCDFEVEDTTAPSDDPTEPSTEPPAEFALNRSDITFFYEGESWDLYDGTVAKSEITWTTDDETVAAISGGKVVAVGRGRTEVHGEYNGTKVSCIIRCNFTTPDSGGETTPAETDPIVDGNGGVSEGGTNPVSPYKLNTEDRYNDVTISVGESFKLLLLDKAGNPVSVTWSVKNDAICTVSGNDVTGKASGVTTVYVNYEGTEYACIVRVK